MNLEIMKIKKFLETNKNNVEIIKLENLKIEKLLYIYFANQQNPKASNLRIIYHVKFSFCSFSF